MLKAIAITATLMFTTPATAEEVTLDEMCSHLYDFAELVMTHRQSGTSLRKVLSVASNDMLKAIIFAAYEQPRFSSDSYQRESIQDFANEVYFMCMQAE